MSQLNGKKRIAAIVIFIIIFSALFFSFFITPSFDFPTKKYFVIKTGEPLSVISKSLEENEVIKSSLVFRGIVSILLRGANNAVAGDYYFERPLDVFTVAWRITHGIFNINPIKVTIPEGLNKYEISTLVKKSIPLFNSKTFAKNAKEGEIFPDTYFLAESTTPADLIRITHENFVQKIEGLSPEIKNSGRSLNDIIKMASILETEANQTETRRTIAGVLWRRIDLGMPLQVDVSFKYINGKNSFELTGADLTIDSPYNSYKYAGLPPTPISNPGIDAITAAITPISSKYLYFLSDKKGIMHYAVTFDEHKANKAKYLK